MNHIAYIASEYAHPNLPSAGGIGSFIKTMADSLTETGINVTVFVCFAMQDRTWMDNKIKIIEIKDPATPYISPITNRIKIRNVIKKHIKLDKIDLIEAPDWEGIQAFCNFKIPLITRIHGSVSYFNQIQNIKKSKIIFFFEKLSLKISNKIIAVSEFSGKLTGEVFNIPDLKFQVIYNGIDNNKFNPSNIENDKNDNNIIYFGTLVRKKGIIELAHIFNELIKLNSKAKLYLIGKDTVDYKLKISTWKAFKDILSPIANQNVIYEGTIPYNEMSKKIANANVCVFPSFAEAFPISWLEAMSLEKPIVASSIGWAKESIVDNVSGLLEHPLNHKEYALKIAELLSNKKKAKEIGVNARKRVISYFNQKKLIEENILMYKKLTSNE